jgi:hypothetical protein
MASEISVSVTMTNSNLRQSIAPGSKSIDQSGKRRVTNVQNIPTTAAGTALTMGAVTGKGWAYFENRDLTNFVEVGVQSGGTFYGTLKLKPGEFALGRLTTATPFARADTGATDLFYDINDD